MRIRLGGHDARWFELGGWHEPSPGALRFDSVALALQFLRAAVEPGTMHGLRARLAEREVATHRLDDAAVLARIAAALHAGSLAIFGHGHARYSTEDTVEEVRRVVLPAPPPRLPAAPEEPPARAPVVPEPTPLPAMAPADQARTLRDAARRAAPFCEICRPPAPAPARASRGESQARTLRAAARNAAPFCEICE